MQNKWMQLLQTRLLLVALALTTRAGATSEGPGSFLAKVSAHQKRVVNEIITTMGSSNLLQLGLQYYHLKSLGKTLDALTPLEFLGVIFSNPQLRLQMQEVEKSSFKWSGFMDGLRSKLKYEREVLRLSEELSSFAQLVDADEQSLRQAASRRDWDGLVHALVRTAGGRGRR